MVNLSTSGDALLARLLVNRRRELDDRALLSRRVHMEHRSVSGGEDALMFEELDDGELRLEASHRWARLGSARREAEARHDVLVRDVLELDARILATDEI